MSINILPIGSGSKGNSTLITNEKNKILIDCGLSVNNIIKGLAKYKTTVSEIDGILITHGHIDHVLSLYELSDNYQIPVYTHGKTLDALIKNRKIKEGTGIFANSSFSIESFEIQAFDIPHDDVSPLGYCIKDQDSAVTVVTDIGYVNSATMEFCKMSQKILIESNHDLEMLAKGKYPYFLKKRIMSERGHLSNEDCATALREILKEGKKEIILGHLSEENNLPELAWFSIVNRLKEEGMEANREYCLAVAPKRI